MGKFSEIVVRGVVLGIFSFLMDVVCGVIAGGSFLIFRSQLADLFAYPDLASFGFWQVFWTVIVTRRAGSLLFNWSTPESVRQIVEDQ